MTKRKGPAVLMLAALAFSSASGTTRSRADSAGVADEAARIMEDVFRVRTEGRRFERLQMTISDPSGVERIRTMQVRTMRMGDMRKGIVVIDSPADSRGVGFLTVDYDDPKKGGERWLYLPNLGRTTRVAGSQVSRSFMGSDFSYGDLSLPNPKLFAFTLINPSVTIDGEECWYVGAKPIDANIEHELGYTSSEFWISKSKMTPVRIRTQLADGKTKYMKASNFKQHGERWLDHRFEARTVLGEKLLSQTVVTMLAVDLSDDAVAEGDFTKQKLEQGL